MEWIQTLIDAAKTLPGFAVAIGIAIVLTIGLWAL